MADPLSVNEYGRAANDAIAAWKREMAKPAKKLGEACNELTMLEKKRTLTDDEKKRLKECTPRFTKPKSIKTHSAGFLKWWRSMSLWAWGRMSIMTAAWMPNWLRRWSVFRP